MPTLRRLLPLAVLVAALAVHAPGAAASSTQAAILEDDTLLRVAPDSTLATLQALGVTHVRVAVSWYSIAPGGRHKPAGFDASDPADPNYSFATYDAIVRAAQQHGIVVYFMLAGPAPLWAAGPGAPPSSAPYSIWRPSAREFGAFVHAVGRRYDGSFVPAGAGSPLPAVRFWSIWNEANYGYDLAPATTGHDAVETGAALYRGLLDAAWSSLVQTGHTPGRDTILIGETAPRGVENPGAFGGVKPLRFLRALYCVDGRFHPLRGTAARLRGCPTTAAASRRFRSQNPALFQASGFAAHLYSSQANPTPPNVPTGDNGQRGVDPDYADLPGIGRLEGTLDRLNRAYGSRTRFPIWNTEYGYRTRPPDPHAGVSLSAAALYINWAEYLSWRQPRLRSYDQYLFQDPSTGAFASGLEFPDGKPKPDFYAYRLPLYLPAASGRRGHTLEVWGCVRGASWAATQSGQAQLVRVQFERGRHGPWVTEKTVTVHNPRGYFDIRVGFPASGNVRLAWTPPSGPTEYSRTAAVTVH